MIARIEPLGPRIIELGGSRAQRDVFHDTLIEACFRGGDMDRAGRLVAERVRRRPDHFWVNRRQAGAAPATAGTDICAGLLATAAGGGRPAAPGG